MDSSFEEYGHATTKKHMEEQDTFFPQSPNNTATDATTKTPFSDLWEVGPHFFRNRSNMILLCCYVSIKIGFK